MNVPMGVPGAEARFLEYGWLSISIPNLIMITLMIVLFVLALVLPFPTGHDEKGDE
jgi:hypothetical protein